MISLIVQNENLIAIGSKKSIKSSKINSSVPSKRAVFEARSEKTEGENNYPFIAASNKIAPAEVAGICIKNGKAILLSFDNKCSAESLPDDFSFSDLNFFRRYPKLISVELNGLTITSEMLENLIKFLPSGLKGFLVRSCSIEDGNYSLLANLIEMHKSISSLSIIMPTLVGDGVTAILAALKDHAMKYLGLTVDELSTDDSNLLAKIISNSAQTLHGLSLGWNKINSKGKNPYQKISMAISKIKNLKKLEFTVLTLTENDLGQIAEFLKNCKGLNALKIYFGNLKKLNHVRLFKCAQALKEALSHLTALESFDISSMELPPEVMQLMLEAIGSMKKLNILNISGIALNEKGAQILSESLKECDSLTTLMANHCEINPKILSVLFKVMDGSPLRYIYLRGNMIKEGVRSFPIVRLSDARIIDFSQNGIIYEDARAFIESTKSHSNLYAVNFSGNTEIEDVSGAERTSRNDELAEWKLKNNLQVLFLGL
jgi:Ran GTPase-activating protein (RanGAP) involved in mRNA processing and transport